LSLVTVDYLSIVIGEVAVRFIQNQLFGFKKHYHHLPKV